MITKKQIRLMFNPVLNEEQKQEEYLFSIAKAVLKWADVKYTEEELSNLVMLDLINIK